MARYRLTIAYDGTDFHGWQRQFAAPVPKPGDGQSDDVRLNLGEGAISLDDPVACGQSVEQSRSEPARQELRTVQKVVQRAVCEAVREPVSLIGASRTDAGVHAWGQTAAFTTSDDRRGAPDERLVLAINARLPPDVVVRSCVRTRVDFDPIGDCVAKAYRYTLHAARDRPLWNRRLVHHIYMPLNEEAMREGAARFIGEHDFTAFAAAGHGRLTTVRRVFDCRIERPGDGEMLEMHIVGNGFLWNMVRIIGGTLVDIGLGRKKPEDVTAAILARDRRLAGPTLPALGLCLMWGLYPGDLPAASTAAGEDGGA